MKVKTHSARLRECGVRHKAVAPARSILRQEERSGAERSRTADLLNAIQALSQLSYSPRIRVIQQPVFPSPNPPVEQPREEQQL